MKLKNIIIALSALVAFSACSNDDDGGKQGKGKASLSIRIANKTLTKADDPHELPGEANINNLATFVFSATTLDMVGGKMETLTNVSHEYEITGIPADSGSDPVLIVLVANAPESVMSGISNYNQLQDALAQLSNQQQSSLTMSTQVITTEYPLDYGDNNYIGFGADYTNINNITEPLWLTRLPARFDLVALRTNFTRPELLGRTVTINSVYYANVKMESRYFSVADWGVVEVEGEYGFSSIRRPGLIIDNDNPEEDIYYSNYAMENLNTGNRPTYLMINATLSASDDYEAETVTFSHAVNQNGLSKGYDHNYVKRNYVYNITATFGDNAFDGTNTDPDPDPDPDPEIPPVDPVRNVLSVQVEVVGWGIIEQPVEID